MRDHRPPRLFGRRSERGSALILVMMILLVLSAVGMVALRDVSRTVQQAGAYRVQSQARTFSDSAAQYATKRAGDDAKSFWQMMTSSHVNDLSELGSGDRMGTARLGAYAKLTQRPGDSTTKETDFPELHTTTDETGLFYNDANSAAVSFETKENQAAADDSVKNTSFTVVLRDPIDGIPAPGYSSNYCFKKVTVASRARVGKIDPEWEGSNMIAEERTVSEALIGPVECGAQ